MASLQPWVTPEKAGRGRWAREVGFGEKSTLRIISENRLLSVFSWIGIASGVLVTEVIGSGTHWSYLNVQASDEK